MREIRPVLVDIDRQLADAAWSKQQLDAERCRAELRPSAMRLFSAVTAKLTWSRTLVSWSSKNCPDDLLTYLLGTARVRRSGRPHLPLLDHLIVGDGHRYFSFREAGLMGATPASR